MKKFFSFILPVVVIAVCLGIGMTLIRTAPKAERRQPPPEIPVVETITVNATNYPVIVDSQGTVIPRTESTLIPEVSGQIVKASEKFQSGGFFEAGEVLLQIDPRNYENAVVVAQSDLAQAGALLDEEKARAVQAQKDWEVLKLSEEPNDLALRKPQLKSAQAAVAAASARLEQANINLDRTFIRAPYAGLVLEKNVDVGQYVSPGNILAKIYAVDLVEIRLPLSNNQLAYLDLPESFRGGENAITAQPGYPVVHLTARVGNQTHRWKGRVVRTEGAVDTQSQQTFVIAQVEDPYARHHGLPLKVGQFVEAQIDGRVLADVFVVPRSVIRKNGEVLIVTSDNTIDRRPVEVVWNDDDQAVIRTGLVEGERISVTPLPYAVSGTQVRANDVSPTSS